MQNIDNIRTVISQKLKEHLNLKEILLFGSWARNENKPDSDIDIVVILNEEGINLDYESIINKRIKIAKILSDIKSKVEIDNLVYTKDEWELLLKSDNGFINNIVKEGISIL